MQATHLTLRIIPGPTGDIPAGTLVPADTWANVRALESLGKLRRLGPGDGLPGLGAGSEPRDTRRKA